MEGVCLLQVLAAAKLEIAALVYVKRMCHEMWADERECDIHENVEALLKKERELADMFSENTGPQSSSASSALPALAEEIIRYHACHRPFERATFLYLRDDC